MNDDTFIMPKWVNVNVVRTIESYRWELTDAICDNMPTGVWFTVPDCLTCLKAIAWKTKVPNDRCLIDAGRIILNNFIDIEKDGHNYRWNGIGEVD